MKRYDKYKPSGIDWIGEVPEHWKLRRIRHLVKEDKDSIKIGPFGSSLTGKVIAHGDYKVYGQWNIIDKDFEAGQNTVTEGTFNDLVSYQIVEKDILISMMGTVGKCATIPEGIKKGIMDSHVIKIRLDNDIMSSDYFEYVYDKDHSAVVYPQIQQLKKGSIMDGLNSSLLKDFVLPVPPMDEQEAILTYLDARCGDIDKVVATQEKRIALLNEMKQSIITQAVTRGLNPDAKMKDSGVEWIGMAPEEWEVGRLKYFLELLNGRAYLQHELQEEGKYRILRVGNFFTNDQWYYSDMELEPNKYCEKGDLLFAWSASFGPYIWDAEKVIYHYHIWKVNLLRNYDKHYAYYMLMSLSDYKRKDVHGSTMTHITMESMNNAMIPVPSTEEQKAIVEYLDSYCGTIDKQIKAVTRQIELLREYKQSLITEVVTGKRKVC